MKDFTEIADDQKLFQDNFFFIVKDAYPVSPGHLLIISKQVKEDYFSLTDVEQAHLKNAILAAKEIIEKEFEPDGYNIGMNCGESAGQTVSHFHCHVIPRYKGDMVDPRGGVRHCIDGKGYY